MMVATAESISAALAALRERKSTALMASPMRPSISAATSALRAPTRPALAAPAVGGAAASLAPALADSGFISPCDWDARSVCRSMRRFVLAASRLLASLTAVASATACAATALAASAPALACASAWLGLG